MNVNIAMCTERKHEGSCLPNKRVHAPSLPLEAKPPPEADGWNGFDESYRIILTYLEY
jgi:hypothetical protein